MSTEAKIMTILEGAGASCCMDSADDRQRLCDFLLADQPWVHDPSDVYLAIKDSLIAVIKSNLGYRLDVTTASVMLDLVDEMARNSAQIVTCL